MKNVLNRFAFAIFLAALLLFWQIGGQSGIINTLFLPTPLDILKVLVRGYQALLPEVAYTITISLASFALSFVFAALAALLMDSVKLIRSILYPFLIISQTIPTVVLAPLFVLWLGYSVLPKIILIVSVCFFPICLSLLDGLRKADPDMQNMLKSMGATRLQIFVHVRLPSAVDAMFSGLKIAATYCIMGGVIAEWLGGDRGIGVYMIRAKRSYAYDKMFAAVLLVIVSSMLMVALVNWIRWMTRKTKKRTENI